MKTSLPSQQGRYRPEIHRHEFNYLPLEDGTEFIVAGSLRNLAILSQPNMNRLNRGLAWLA